MPKLTPRPYQQEAHDAVWAEFDKGVKSTLLVAATGVGKNMIASMICGTQARKGKPTLFLAHRRTLIEQPHKTFLDNGLISAVEMASEKAYRHVSLMGRPDVVVGSIQTMKGRRLQRWDHDKFGLIIIDECHRSLAKSYLAILDHFKGTRFLGATATPSRGDRKNLGSLFETRAYEYGLARAIKEGYLVPIRTKLCQVSVDLRGIRTTRGDFNQGDLEDRIGPKIEPLARGFAKEIGSRKSIAFLPDVGSSLAFANVLSEIGVPARYVAGEQGKYGQPEEDRKENLAAFDRNEIQVICCCDLLVEGYDNPPIEAVGNIRPTLQWNRFCQQAGRGTRLSPETGKKDLLLIDFDWKTDSSVKDLFSSVMLFDDGSLDEEIVQIALEIEKEKKSKGEEVDVMATIEEAKERSKIRKSFRIPLTGRTENYRVLESTAGMTSEMIGYKMHPKHDLGVARTNAPPATQKQIEFLRVLGIDNAEKITAWGAKKLIDKLLDRERQGLSSPDQIRKLVRMGYRAEDARQFSSSFASEVITFCSATQLEMF